MLRKSVYENEIQWQARRLFIEKHRRRVPIEQLDALSMVWANMKFLRCHYPRETEDKVEKLEADSTEALDIPPKIKVKRKKRKKKAIIKDFTLYVHDKGEPEDPFHVLDRNMHRSKKSVEFRELGMTNDFFNYALFIDNTLIATGQALTERKAKRNCAEKGVEILRARQPVVNEFLLHAKLEVVEKNELFIGNKIEAPRISENNVGMQMLRRMGWTGGGLGSNGTGRAEPVTVNEAQGRRGFGKDMSAANKVSSKNIGKLVRNFIMDHHQKHLRFSSDLSKEERAIVHQISKKYGLFHRSYGKGSDRYLIIRKRL